GISHPRESDLSGLPSQIAGEVRGFDPASLVEKKDRKRLNQMSREFRFAVGGAALALADAKIAPGTLDPERFGITFAAGSQSADMPPRGPAAKAALTPPADRLDLAVWGERGFSLVPPMWLLSCIPNIGAGYLAIMHDARGPINAVTQGEAAGVLALGEAARTI